MSVAESLQQIAVCPNERCTVEPCGSTDSFYRSHKEQLWKTQHQFTPVGENMARRIRLQTVSVEVWLSWILFVSLKT